MTEARSQLLKSMPTATGIGQRTSAGKRLMITLPVLALILLIFHLVGEQFFDKSGFSYFLYHIHDTYYLWTKGNFYTRYFPESLIWWSLMATVLLLWLGFFLAARSKTRRWHIRLIRYVMDKNFLSDYLVISTYWLRRGLGLKQQLLYEVVNHERNKVLIQGMQARCSQPDNGLREKIVNHTIFYIRLLLVHRPATDINDHLNAAVCFHDAFFLIFSRHYIARDTKGPQEPAPRLAEVLDEIVAPIVKNKDVAVRREDSKPQPAFSKERIAEDLLLVASLANEKILLEIFGSEREKPKKVLQDKASNFLAESVGEHYALLVECLNKYEAAAFKIHSFGSRFGNRQAEPDLPFDGTVDPTELSLIARLCLGLALDMAYLAESPDIAVGYVDIYQALAMVAEVLSGGTGRMKAAAGQISSFIGDLPNNKELLFCAELAKARLDALEEQLLSCSIVKWEDVEYVKMQISDLYNAAQPAFSRQMESNNKDFN